MNGGFNIVVGFIFVVVSCYAIKNSGAYWTIIVPIFFFGIEIISTVYIFGYDKRVRIKEAEYEKLHPSPPYCIAGDYLIAKVVNSGYDDQGMQGWRVTGYGEIIRGIIEEYRSNGYFKVNGKWYSRGSYIGDIEVSNILWNRDETGYQHKEVLV